MNQNYTPAQKEVISKIYGLVGQLSEVEQLRAEGRQMLTVGDALDQAVADIALDNCRPYESLEKDLRAAIIEARGLGLQNDPGVIKFGRLSAVA